MKKIISWSLFLLIIILFMHPDLVLAKSSVNRDIKGSDLLVPLPDQSTEMQDKDLGVGPAKHVELGPINAKMVGEGKTIYGNQCIICHDLDQNKLGPALKMVTKSRTPGIHHEHAAESCSNAERECKCQGIAETIQQPANARSCTESRKSSIGTRIPSFAG